MIEDFKDLFSQHAAGVVVVTQGGESDLLGVTATSVVSVSAEPSIAAFSLTQGSRFQQASQVGNRVTLNFLGATHAGIAKDFARGAPDKFERSGWYRSELGGIVLQPVGRWASGPIIAMHDLGTSTLVALELDEIRPGATAQEQSALIYHNRRFSDLGSANPV